MKINVLDYETFEDIDEDFENFQKFEPSRKSMEPVSGKQDMQRRAENGINRFRKHKVTVRD